ncbi:MAG: CDP-diacylglycerol--serine O-phosphatidyltransferase [Rikenellaceae bacterium]|jgi:CDP-diacylglycerol--serine O-phosphatidyltransferase|nr:CDP-diacylglycerol--serine O-phosphatidyltransferase [Rikenellaceae bacterium]
MKIKLFTLPNAITCLNLAAGCVAIERAFAGDFGGAFVWVVVAAVMDFLDGLVARLLHAYSETGKELDSLADTVSFGAAPAFVLFNLLRQSGFSGWEPWLVFVVALFSALRLAKFNVDTRQSTEFIGLPTPANALLIVSLIFLIGTPEGKPLAFLLSCPWYLIGLALALSALLVSEIPMFSLKFKSLGWRENKIRYIFLGLSLLLLVLSLFGWWMYAPPMILVLYILLSLIKEL